jgi:type VI secretion system protein ImpB
LRYPVHNTLNAREKIVASNSNSGQKFISRNRKPRVHITYEDPYDAEKLVELPFVMGVLADLSGNASPVAKPDMADRKFLDVDMDNFDKRMAAIEPAVSVKVPNKLGANEGGEKLSLNLKFTKMDDFSPAAIARQVPSMAKLLAAREQLANLLKYMDGKAAAEDTLKKLLADPQLMAAMKAKLDQRPSADGSAQ